jgi:hypothetical protein
MMVSGGEHADIRALDEAYDATVRDARAVAAGLSETQGAWREHDGSWSVAECLDHLATANRVYVEAMRSAAEPARQQGRRRRGPARPGLLGGWFVRSLEPPARPGRKRKAPRKIRPRVSPPLADAMEKFLASMVDVHAFLHRYGDIDLNGVRFPNPFVRGIRFSLATGLNVIAAHNRRHLWQAWRVRQAAERAATRSTA